VKHLVLLADDTAPETLCPLHNAWGTSMLWNGVPAVQCPGDGTPHWFTWAPAQ
jgi:hypothetical protein